MSDHVEVFSKTNKSDKAVRWVSDGLGTYEVSDVDNLDFARGTKIILKLLPAAREFSQEIVVEKMTGRKISRRSYAVQDYPERRPPTEPKPYASMFCNFARKTVGSLK